MDLTKINTVFGELPQDVQEALMALPVGQVQFRTNTGWVDAPNSMLQGSYTYRQNPVPSFYKAFRDMSNGTVFQVGTRRYVKYTDEDEDEILCQLESPNHSYWYNTEGWCRVNGTEVLTTAEWTADDVTILCQPDS